jgi:hypothetical protein
MHMPRALAITRKLDWRMMAWPSDFITGPQSSGSIWGVTGNLELMDYVVHEWIGLEAYRLTGKAQ